VGIRKGKLNAEGKKGCLRHGEIRKPVSVSVVCMDEGETKEVPGGRRFKD